MDKRNSGPLNWFFALVFVLSLIIFAVGVYLAAKQVTFAVMAVGLGVVVGVLTLWLLGLSITTARQAETRHMDTIVEALTTRLQEMSVLLNMITENQLLSDRAKAIAYREKDRDALRRAIREEMSRKDWEAAIVLADDMSTAFGYRQEAERFKEEINNERQEVVRRQISEAVAVIDRYCRAEAWSDALREAERLQRIFPGNEVVQNLPHEIEARRQAHKRQLMDSWNDALTRHDIDGSIEILKKLDLYLSRAEGEAMEEAARGVFKERLNNLRVQFTLAVQDHKWPQAIQVGDAIMREFPNSRIAGEVREKMDTLRQRAATPEIAKV